ncbi:hypothetical protein BDN72DRAFT_157647 [Pluteus cervinus]|uniref:Uncharacterized protein n=1 Tax=Pluteus cervinus TaxID=181527 RepID=A0ACD3AKK3_9AGAR|nr:hypothetical protein BDN72DRAFT_157647 [Pluteus cervinus]
MRFPYQSAYTAFIGCHFERHLDNAPDFVGLSTSEQALSRLSNSARLIRVEFRNLDVDRLMPGIIANPKSLLARMHSPEFLSSWIVSAELSTDVHEGWETTPKSPCVFLVNRSFWTSTEIAKSPFDRSTRQQESDNPSPSSVD